jgi:hypothetical protein
LNRDLSYPKKFLSKAQLIFNLETDVTDVFSVASKKKDTVKGQAVVFPTAPQTITVSNASNDVVIYLATVVTKTGGNLSIVNNNTLRVLSSTIYAAPSPLPPTDKSQFSVVINNTYLPNNLLISLTQNGSNIDIVIDTTALGYNLTSIQDLTSISVIGKFA